MSHPHPFGEASIALFLSTAPVVGVAAVILGERLEAAKRRPRREPPAREKVLPRFEPVGGTE